MMPMHGTHIVDPKTVPVCSTCNDTHRMPLVDREVMCTHCPTPCENCRAGPYCGKTPCTCECHRQRGSER